MINSHIEHYQNIVEVVKNSIDSNMSHIELFLLLCTQPISNGVMIKLNDSSLSVISVNIHDNSTTTININQSEQVYYWIGKWLEFLKQYDTDFEEKSFDYEINNNGQKLHHNIQAKVEVTNDNGKVGLSHFSIILRVKAPEDFIPLTLTLDSIHSDYINQKINKLNLHNKENTKKTKL